MSLRRPRSHKIGISNIDFRTKRDIDNLSIFEPWIAPKDLGTMGNHNYKHPQTIFQSLFSPSGNINTHKDIVNDYPDPRFHTTAQFYKKNKILVNTKSFFNSQRVANLEESFKGKDVFTGDSTNVAEIMRIRKGKKFDGKKLIRNIFRKSFSREDHKNQEEKMERLFKDKQKANKNASQETQLVKINSYMDKGDKSINLKKIEEIRIALRRRYGNRKKINKIFQHWAKTFPNKITAYDAYRMINSLSIPINFNETKALIASGSNSRNEYLTLEEFSNLIHDPTKMLFDESKKLIYGEKEEKKICDKIISNNKSQFDDKNISKLKDFITQRLYILNKNMKEIIKDKYSFTDLIGEQNSTNINLIDFNKFLQGILSLKPSANLGKEEYIKRIFDEFKGKNDLLDMRSFNVNIFEKNSKEFMTKMKDKTLEICKEQYEEKKNKLQKYVNENVDKVKPLFFQKKIDLDKQILQKREIIENQKSAKDIINKSFEKQLNGTIPSSKWLHHIYDNRNQYFKYLNNIESSFSVKPIIKSINIKRNTRFSSVPAWRNTADILVGDEKSATFINEKERFTIDRDVNKEDKRKKIFDKMKKENRIRTTKEKYENNNFLRKFLKEEKNIYSDMEKSKRLAVYDEMSKNRNFIYE